MPNPFTLSSANPLLGRTVTVTWTRSTKRTTPGGARPAGHTATGTLTAVYYKFACIGKIATASGEVTVPWSRNFITIEVIEPGDQEARVPGDENARPAEQDGQGSLFTA